MSVRVGCFSAFWGDSVMAARQLVKQGNIQYLVGDYLAEVTMGILAKRKAKGGKGSKAYISEFITFVIKPLLKDLIARNIRCITNAGGLDPEALKSAIEEVAKQAGISVKVAAVYGDDISEQYLALRKDGSIKEFNQDGVGSSDKFPALDKNVESLNAYIGAEPIKYALDHGAQIVVTGRCVDSAVVLAPLMHEFNWTFQDFDQLASGSLAGHIIECGCQATGGNFTDWKLSCYSENGGWSNMGYPIVEVSKDGSFIVCKPDGTGGIVSQHSVGEQLLYEIGDPGSYILPDVIVDLRQVTLEQVGKNRVLVKNARGRSPTPFLKVSGIYMDGYKVTGQLLIGGLDAREKALEVGNAIVSRASQFIKKFGMEDYVSTNVEALGSGHTHGKWSTDRHSREVVLRISAQHENPQALKVFLMEIAPSATCMAPGIIGVTSGRPRPQGNMVHFSCLVDKQKVSPKVSLGHPSMHQTFKLTGFQSFSQPIKIQIPKSISKFEEKDLIMMPLVEFCVARSGDKGDSANVGIMSRKPEFYTYLLSYLTEERVSQVYDHLMHEKGTIKRYELPGCYGMNFLITNCLGGGGLSSLQVDRQGKSYAQMILSMLIPAPRKWLSMACEGYMNEGVLVSSSERSSSPTKDAVVILCRIEPKNR